MHCLLLHVVHGHHGLGLLRVVVQAAVLPVVPGHEVPPHDLAPDVGVLRHQRHPSHHLTSLMRSGRIICYMLKCRQKKQIDMINLLCTESCAAVHIPVHTAMVNSIHYEVLLRMIGIQTGLENSVK